MEREAASAAYTARHEDAPYHDGTFTDWSKTQGPSHPYKFDDGVVLGVADRDIAPWDKFTTEVNASPIPPSESDQQEEPAHPDQRG